jgi:hypothetical protein
VEACYVYDFCCKLTSPGQPCQGHYRDSSIGENFTLIYAEFSNIGKNLAKISVFSKK